MKKLRYTVIKNKDQYNEYCEILEDLVQENQSKHIEDEIDLLSLLISDYNERAMEYYKLELNPVELIVDLIEENNLTQLELAKRLKVSPQLINDVVKYRREITKNLAHKLAEEFKLKFSIFLKSYKLKKAS